MCSGMIFCFLFWYLEHIRFAFYQTRGILGHVFKYLFCPVPCSGLQQRVFPSHGLQLAGLCAVSTGSHVSVSLHVGLVSVASSAQGHPTGRFTSERQICAREESTPHTMAQKHSHHTCEPQRCPEKFYGRFFFFFISRISIYLYFKVVLIVHFKFCVLSLV